MLPSNEINLNEYEQYGFTWPGKKKAIEQISSPVNKILKPSKNESVNWDSTSNYYIEGDNLDVLKLLKDEYSGLIKAVYIDPPYNTGKDFVYKDHFKSSKKEYLKLSNLDKENKAEKQETVQNECIPESHYRHSKWCSMMYPRLSLAKDLMCQDGVIFISIGEDERTSLKNICDEIFGESNFVTEFIWEKTQHFGRQKLNFYNNADYVLCYCKSLYQENGSIKEILVESIKTELEDAPLFNASNPIKTLSFPKGTVKFKIKDGTYSSSSSEDYHLDTPVTVKNGKNQNSFSLTFRSRWSNDNVQKEIAKGTSFLIKTQTFAVRAKYGKSKKSNESPKQIIFTNKTNPRCTVSRFNCNVGTSENASQSLKKTMGENCFSYPKPVSLIEYLCSLLWDYTKEEFAKDYIFMDFFAGSCSSAEAIMNLNAKDCGTRSYIMVQIPENCSEKSPAKKAGYTNICEIGKKRIKIVGEQINASFSNVDTGFKVYKTWDN